MSEVWQKKKYYPTRVLVEYDNVINNRYPGGIVCLSGGEIALLHNLLQYAHRRATWVIRYYEQYYISPDNRQWDTIEQFIAELEDKIAMCDELAAQVGNVADAILCLCSKMADASTSSGAGYSQLLQYLLDQMLTDGDLTYGDPVDPMEKPVDQERCIIAHLTWAYAYELLTELLQPAQLASLEVLVPAIGGLLGTMIGGPVLGIPVAVFMALCQDLVQVWAEAELQNVENAYTSYQAELECALYNGLAYDVNTAAAMAAAVIDTIPDFAALDAALMRILFGKTMIDRMMVAYANKTAWAVLNSGDADCSACEDESENYILCDKPIHTDNWSGDCLTEGGVVSVGVGPRYPDCEYLEGETAEYDISMTGTYHVKSEAWWYSGAKFGSTMGYVTLQARRISDQVYETIGAVTLTTTENAMTAMYTVNDGVDDVNMALYDRVQLHISAQAGSCTDDPAPGVNVLGYCFTLLLQE